MNPSTVRDMAEDMMVNRFSWQRSGPIQVAEGANGARIILDGHHRAAAAIEAGLENVPIQIRQVTQQQWQQLLDEVLDASGLR